MDYDIPYSSMECTKSNCKWPRIKKNINDLTIKPDIICIQETWLKSHLDFILKGYNSVRSDRGKNRGGGFMTFIKDEISYRQINISENECVVTEIFSHKNKRKIKIINYYNPCKA